MQTGARGGAVAGFDPAIGQRRWTLGEDGVQYQSPVVVRVGQRDIVVAVGDAKLIALDLASGRRLFEHAHGGEPVWIASASAVPVPAGPGRVFVKTHVDESTRAVVIRYRPGPLKPLLLVAGLGVFGWWTLRRGARGWRIFFPLPRRG